ncbi:IS701 family transposase [bacterium]|nr:IS701 family transposase [Chloroflexi bacterium CFX6]RIL12735.1 MAG: IS701 family transposase [bacterium]
MGVLVIDETGILKKGAHSMGVRRQYSGTAGWVENCQIAVLLGYATAKGRALLDRALYLPKSWADDRARRAKVGVPETVAFKTKPALAWAMVERALDEGVPARRVAGDSIYGDDPQLRRSLEGRHIGYVMATSHNDARVPISRRTRALCDVVAGLKNDDWQSLSAGDWSQGPRLCDWQLVTPSTSLLPAWRRGNLVQRSVSDPAESKVHRCFFPVETSLATPVRVAGSRWTIETDIEEAKGEVGLDHYEMRSWDGWHRHISLAPLAHAFLSVTEATNHAADSAATIGGSMHRCQTQSITAFKVGRGLLCP